MKDFITRELWKRYEELQKAITKLEKRIPKYPEGSLNCKMNKGTPQYYFNTGSYKDENGERVRNRQYITKKNGDLIQQLAQKSYDLELLGSVKQEYKCLEQLLKCEETKSPESIYDELHMARKLVVTPMFESQEYLEFQWMNQTFIPLSTDNLDTEYYSERGEHVRSKSEVLIANQLSMKGIAYKYECPLQLNYGRTVYPDFTCMSKKTGEIIYWEHLGMMDNPEYCEHNLEKILMYENEGLFPGINLILTHETSSRPISTRLIDKTINAYLC